MAAARVGRGTPLPVGTPQCPRPTAGAGEEGKGSAGAAEDAALQPGLSERAPRPLGGAWSESSPHPRDPGYAHERRQHKQKKLSPKLQLRGPWWRGSRRLSLWQASFLPVQKNTPPSE